MASSFRTGMAGPGVRLSQQVICDGFLEGLPIRVQTHVHEDHMDHFDRSKWNDIYCLEPTRALLIENGDAAMRYRQNLRGVKPAEPVELPSGERLTLVPSGHMLGAAQVVVEHDDGYRCGYSGDFSWPLEEVIRVDELVIDSTYGSPNSRRPYTQDTALEELRRAVSEAAKRGPVVIKAWRGLAPRALEVVGEVVTAPEVFATSVHFNDIEVHRRFGFDLPAVQPSRELPPVTDLAPGVVVVLSTGERMPGLALDATTFVLKATHNYGGEPLINVGGDTVYVGLSDHADFDETLEYVEATGARRVLTDNVRGPHGIELSIELTRRLGVDAAAGLAAPDRSWGGGWR